jgi:spoIIIJ-associated protein
MTDYDKIEFISKTITELLSTGGIPARVDYEDSLTRGLVFNISSRDSSILIGHQGANLYALEVIVHAIVAKHFSGSENPVWFSVDINEYKKKREWHLKQLAKEAVDHLKKTGKPLTLSPMPKYERKFIHTYIQEQFPHVTTESVGVDPQRKIKLSI